MCVPQVLFNPILLQEATRSAKDNFPNYAEAEKDLFYSEWTRKIVHARVNELIESYKELNNTKQGIRNKGGETLRDRLYTATEKKNCVKARKSLF